MVSTGAPNCLGFFETASVARRSHEAGACSPASRTCTPRGPLQVNAKCSTCCAPLSRRGGSTNWRVSEKRRARDALEESRRSIGDRPRRRRRWRRRSRARRSRGARPRTWRRAAARGRPRRTGTSRARARRRLERGNERAAELGAALLLLRRDEEHLGDGRGARGPAAVQPPRERGDGGRARRRRALGGGPREPQLEVLRRVVPWARPPSPRARRAGRAAAARARAPTAARRAAAARAARRGARRARASPSQTTHVVVPRASSAPQRRPSTSSGKTRCISGEKYARKRPTACARSAGVLATRHAEPAGGASAAGATSAAPSRASSPTGSAARTELRKRVRRRTSSAQRCSSDGDVAASAHVGAIVQPAALAKEKGEPSLPPLRTYARAPPPPCGPRSATSPPRSGCAPLWARPPTRRARRRARRGSRSPARARARAQAVLRAARACAERSAVEEAVRAFGRVAVAQRHELGRRDEARDARVHAPRARREAARRGAERAERAQDRVALDVERVGARARARGAPASNGAAARTSERRDAREPLRRAPPRAGEAAAQVVRDVERHARRRAARRRRRAAAAPSRAASRRARRRARGAPPSSSRAAKKRRSRGITPFASANWSISGASGRRRSMRRNSAERSAHARSARSPARRAARPVVLVEVPPDDRVLRRVEHGVVYPRRARVSRLGGAARRDPSRARASQALWVCRKSCRSRPSDVVFLLVEAAPGWAKPCGVAYLCADIPWPCARTSSSTT